MNDEPYSCLMAYRASQNSKHSLKEALEKLIIEHVSSDPALALAAKKRHNNFSNN